VTTASVADNVTTTAEMDIMTTTTEESTTTTTTTTTSPVLRGNIYDCNKTLITYSTRTEDGGEERHFTDGYKYSFGNIISQYSAGIDTELEETLRTVNPSAVDGDEKVACPNYGTASLCGTTEIGRHEVGLSFFCREFVVKCLILATTAESKVLPFRLEGCCLIAVAGYA
jgi:hypothetical protein